MIADPSKQDKCDAQNNYTLNECPVSRMRSALQSGASSDKLQHSKCRAACASQTSARRHFCCRVRDSAIARRARSVRAASIPTDKVRQRVDWDATRSRLGRATRHQRRTSRLNENRRTRWSVIANKSCSTSLTSATCVHSTSQETIAWKILHVNMIVIR